MQTLNTSMITFKQFILQESMIPEIDWEHPIRMQGTPRPFPIIAEYKDKNFHIHINLDPYSFENKTQAMRKAVVYGDDWNSQLIWIHVRLGKQWDILKGFNFSKYFADTPENRIKVEHRYKELIYALMKTVNKRPKESKAFIEQILEKPL